MDETTFFEYDGVRVTNSRFIVDGQTFAMSNITSVKPLEKKPNRILPLLFVVLGIVLALSEIYFGLIVAAVGLIWWFTQKSVYHIMLHTAGGETSALKTNQREYLQQVITALNNAIIHRG